ncbi:uracil-DNA glycosylase family protein [Burkholderia gladioli]|uniref:uracil-DNA glycosylase family protein n=1 Tax=Burkholderia gladioli TaxID=28095 RepID=UPI0016418991|nr:uracil-DNA glycosylase family protein [Burkholderia gladioli]
MPSLSLTTDNRVTMTVGGQDVQTLRDILPAHPGLEVLFVAKTPAPVSVAAGHYFQGAQGKMFWNRLKEYGLFNPTTRFEDDSLLDHGFGITDIVKVPRAYGNEPSPDEYAAGMDRILELIRVHHPRVVVFVYKRVLDNLLRYRFGVREKSEYGFNAGLSVNFSGAGVFAFPLPGTPCNAAQAVVAMRELAEAVGRR